MVSFAYRSVISRAGRKSVHAKKRSVIIDRSIVLELKEEN